MPKKKDLELLLNEVPSPTGNQTKILTFLFAVFLFSILIYIGSVTYTGIAVIDTGEQLVSINNQNIVLGNQFEVLEVDKTPDSVLEVNIKSNLLVNVFAEIGDCSYWKNGQDRDNAVWYSVNGIKDGSFKIGDPSENTAQQVDLYKTNYLCLIFINREFPKTGSLNYQSQEKEVGLWRIV